jgi:competence protein ComEA
VEASIQIYITGSVKSPGVIKVPEGYRLSEALELVDGTLPDADLSRINLAQRVRDEGMYYIPAIGEEIPVLPADSGGAANPAVKDGKVNINHADQQLLETLNGIGPSRARSIIEYREQNGGFASIEEIMNVSGIGEKIFHSLKDQITVK